MEQKGIEETKEVLKAILELVKVSAEVLKDGAQLQDVVDGYVKLAGDPVKKAEIEAALKNIQAVPEEVKDIQLVELVDLVMVVVKELPELLDALKKQKA